MKIKTYSDIQKLKEFGIKRQDLREISEEALRKKGIKVG